MKERIANWLLAPGETMKERIANWLLALSRRIRPDDSDEPEIPMQAVITGGLVQPVLFVNDDMLTIQREAHVIYHAPSGRLLMWNGKKYDVAEVPSSGMAYLWPGLSDEDALSHDV